MDLSWTGDGEVEAGPETTCLRVSSRIGDVVPFMVLLGLETRLWVLSPRSRLAPWPCWVGWIGMQRVVVVVVVGLGRFVFVLDFG